MNISNLRESDPTPKEENANGVTQIIPKPNLTTSSWTKLKDPRIVRVSRAFGGKDRHSKVCTVRGLRDRRVRLSVPTAIQLYDLQDRLGLNQPSKVVDWLLDVAKHEIDELPPLQMPPGNLFAQNLQSFINGGSSENLEGVKTSTNNGINWEDYWNTEKSKEKDHFFGQPSDQSSSSLLVPDGSFLKLLNPSHLSLSRFGSYASSPSSSSMAPNHQEDMANNFNINLSGSQVLMYPPPRGTQFDPNKQINFEMLSSNSSSSSHNPLNYSPLYIMNQGMIRPFQLSMNPKLFPSQENEPDKGD